MRVGLTHMGNLYVGLKALMERLDIDYVVPPLNNRRTLSLGVKYSPNGLCIPFKLTLGNMIEAAELGADVMLQASGFGICRLGYYSRTQEQILHDLGYDVQVMSLQVSERKLVGLLEMLRQAANGASWLRVISAFRFGVAKISALDRIERMVQKVRAVELTKGTASKVFAQAIKAVDSAADSAALKRAEKDFVDQLAHIPRNTQARPLIVGITGEFYVVLEPFSTLDVENELGKLGVEVRRTTFISEWTKFSLFLNPFGFDEKAKIHKAALPYLKRDVGGDGWESVGEKVLHAKDYDGIVHLAPFTCVPEIVAQNIMPSTREKIPVLTIICDEQTGKAGMLTRLEAFVDLLERRRRAKNTKQPQLAV